MLEQKISLLLSKKFTILLVVWCTMIPRTLVSAKRPNIMIILADDVGTGDVPGYWNKDLSKVNMPNLEQLVQSGVTFTDVHSTPICAPSRYVLLSGNYQHRGVNSNGVWNANYQTSQFFEGQQSIANVLRDNGYNTGVFGKWHLGAKISTIKGFTPTSKSKFQNKIPNELRMLMNKNHSWHKPITRGPYDLGFNTSYVSMQGIQRPPFAFFRDDLLQLQGWNSSNIEENITDYIEYWMKGSYEMPDGSVSIVLGQGGQGSYDWDSTSYNKIIVNETEKFIDQHLKERGVNQSFFAYIPLGAAHKPNSPPYQYLDGSPVAGVYPNGHMDILGEMDKVVGSLIQILDERKILEDTIIIFTSDNGGLASTTSGDYGHFSSGELRGAKKSIYEGGHRVPMTIMWGNSTVPKGEKRSHLIGLNDIFATLCELAEVEVPTNQAIDSVSFAKYLFDDQNVKGLRETLGVFAYDNKLTKSSIRMGDLKLIHNYQTDEFEFYNLKYDLGEKRNTIMGNQDDARKMLRELQKYGPCYDTPGKFWVNLKTKRRKKSCRWFRKKKEHRCYRYIEGIYNCRKACSSFAYRNSCDKVKT